MIKWTVTESQSEITILSLWTLQLYFTVNILYLMLLSFVTVSYLQFTIFSAYIYYLCILQMDISDFNMSFKKCVFEAGRMAKWTTVWLDINTRSVDEVCSFFVYIWTQWRTRIHWFEWARKGCIFIRSQLA